MSKVQGAKKERIVPPPDVLRRHTAGATLRIRSAKTGNAGKMKEKK